jgi:hypothetical protein
VYLFIVHILENETLHFPDFFAVKVLDANEVPTTICMVCDLESRREAEGILLLSSCCILWPAI